MYFEGCPVDRVALWDVLMERCPAVDPNFAHKVEAMKRRLGSDRPPVDDEMSALRKTDEYPAARKDAEDWFDGLKLVSKEDFCDPH
jgi:hypothetical protein